MGKSYVVCLLIAELRALGLGILVCGASGVAPMKVAGHTTHSLFHCLLTCGALVILSPAFK